MENLVILTKQNVDDYQLTDSFKNEQGHNHNH